MAEIAESQVDNLIVALMRELCLSEPVSMAKVTKTVGIRRSQMERLLALLGSSEVLGGLDLVRQETRGPRVMVGLTEKGRALCAQEQTADA
ncbi:MAG: hypothetical protein ACYDEV_05030 [Acidiferrobacter sp.]